MIGGYTPMVPAVGLITVLLGAVILVVGLTTACSSGGTSGLTQS